MKKALITGISGQDGSFLAELLLGKGYEVHGLVMRVDLEDISHRLINIIHLLNNIKLHPADLESFPSIFKVFSAISPDECYHFAAQSYVDYSFEIESSTFNTNVNGTHNLLASLKMINPRCKFYFAGSSEMFGKVDKSPQDEKTPFHPRSIYGISKVAGYHLSTNYRNHYDIFSCNGILFNHESERRGFEFVTRKITSSVAKIKLGKQKKLELGNLHAKRDWGYAPEFVNAIWLMLQGEMPEDYVIGTGKTHSVKEFVEIAFNSMGLNWEKYVEINNDYFRPAESVELKANFSKAHKNLGWEPEISFENMIEKMVLSDLNLIKTR